MVAVFFFGSVVVVTVRIYGDVNSTGGKVHVRDSINLIP